MTLRIESPPPVKHPRTTSTPESRSFAFTEPPYVSVHFNLILPCRPFALVVAGAIASSVSLLYITSKSTDAQKKDLFASGRMAFGHLPLVRTHGRRHRQMYVTLI